MLFQSAVLALLIALIALTIHRACVAARWNETLVGHIHALGEQMTTANERITAVLTRIDTATNNIAEDLRGLKKKLEEGVPTEEILAGLETAATALEGVTEEILAGLETAATALEGVAASTEDPVPGDGGGPATGDGSEG